MRGRLALLALLALAACGQEGGKDRAAAPAASPPSSIDATVAAWKKAGLAVPALEPRPDLEGGRCQGGAVEGVEVTLCDFGDAARSKAAEKAGLALAGEATGLALASGPLLLVAVDRGKQDPNGKKLNRIATTFRGK